MPGRSAGVRFRPFDAGAGRARSRATLERLVTIANPLDYHTFIWNQRRALRATFAAMMACGFDLACWCSTFPRADRCSDADWQVALDAWEAARDATGGRAAVVASLPENLPESVAEALIAAGIVPLLGIDEALAAAEAAAVIGAAQAAPLPAALAAGDRAARAAGRRSTSGRASGCWPSTALPHPGGRLVADAGRGRALPPRRSAFRWWSRPSAGARPQDRARRGRP